MLTQPDMVLCLFCDLFSIDLRKKESHGKHCVICGPPIPSPQSYVKGLTSLFYCSYRNDYTVNSLLFILFKRLCNLLCEQKDFNPQLANEMPHQLSTGGLVSVCQCFLTQIIDKLSNQFSIETTLLNHRGIKFIIVFFGLIIVEITNNLVDICRLRIRWIHFRKRNIQP